MAAINDWFSQHGEVVSAEVEKDPADPDGSVTRYKFADGAEVVIRQAYTSRRTGATVPAEVVDSKLPVAKKPADRAPRVVERHTDADGWTYTLWDDEPNHWTKEGPSGAEQRATKAEAEAAQRRIEAEKEKAEAIDRQTKQQEEQNRLARERLEAERLAREADDRRADAAANRPSIVSAPSNQRRIAQMDAAGNISSVDNPNFDEAAYEREVAKEQAKAERDRLALQIEAGKLTEATAASQYKRWFDENVTIPLQRSQEARAQAAELRAAQEAEDRRQQFAASYEKDRQTTAISAGNQAAQTFNSNLQYRVGPKFGEQFSQALNSFQPGAPPAQFTQDAFTFKGPSIEAVARKATAKALAGISPYAQAIATAGQREPIVAGPGPAIGGTPPPAAAAPDYAGMIGDYLSNNPYVPGAGGGEEE